MSYTTEPRTACIRLKRMSATPLYLQLEDLLKKELQRFRPGSKFYTERELCRKFGVSQPVVRTALGNLVKQSYLTRVVPKGTFVENNSIKPRVPKTMTIGVISPLGRYFPHVAAVKGVREEAAKTGYRVTLLENEDFGCNLTHMRKQIGEMRGAVDGIVWVASIMEELPVTPDFLKDISERVVLINLKVEDGGLSSVMADYLVGAHILTSHLIKLGYRRIGFFGEGMKRMAYRLRYEGFVKAMKTGGCIVDDRLVVQNLGQALFQDGYTATEKLLRQKVLPEAVFGVNDHAAHGIVACLKDNGFNVPRDIGVVGFDDISIASEMRPTLTTARQPYYELGLLAMKILFEQVTGRTNPGCTHMVQPQLVIRESCGSQVREKALT